MHSIRLGCTGSTADAWRSEAMCVAHDHLKRPVPGQLRNGAQIHPGHNESTGKGVAVAMLARRALENQVEAADALMRTIEAAQPVRQLRTSLQTHTGWWVDSKSRNANIRTPLQHFIGY